MHLYNKAIASITWSDIERFCEQGTAENTYLEYKRDFPDDLVENRYEDKQIQRQTNRVRLD